MSLLLISLNMWLYCKLLDFFKYYFMGPIFFWFIDSPLHICLNHHGITILVLNA